MSRAEQLIADAPRLTTLVVCTGAGYKTPSSSIAITAASSTHSGESSQLTLDLWKQGPLFDSEQADSKREVIYTLQFDRPFGGWDFVLRNVEGESAGRIFNARGDSSFWLEERGREPAECKSGMFSKAFKVEISGVIYEWKREGETVTASVRAGASQRSCEKLTEVRIDSVAPRRVARRMVPL